MRKPLALGLLLLLTACSPPPPAPAPPARMKLDLAPQFLCQRFVQQFYDWYAALWNADGAAQDLSAIRALNLRPESFSPELTALLMKDALMHRRNPGLVTLDGDPFLSGRYYAGSYMIADIVMKNGHCFADMYDLESPTSEIFVTPELQPVGDDAWEFVNFHYPKHDAANATDLLSVLKASQDEQHEPARVSHPASR